MVELGKLALLDDALLRHHHDEFARDKLLHREKRGNGFVRHQVNQAGAVLAFAGSGGVGDVVNFQPVDAALVGENQQVSVSGGNDQVLDHILGAGRHTDAALAAASLPAVGVDSG